MFKLLFRLIFLALFVLIVIYGISYFNTGNFDNSLLVRIWEWIVSAYECVKKFDCSSTNLIFKKTNQMVSFLCIFYYLLLFVIKFLCLKFIII